MTKQKLQRKTINKDIPSQDKSISIQFSLDGFSFCIEDNASKTPIHFTEYCFEAALATPELLLEKIKIIFTDDTFLQQDFSSVTVIHKNNLSTLVPNSFFDKNKLKTYLEYTLKTFKSDFIAFDDIPLLNSKNVYIPYVNINNYLFQNFGEFEYKHHSSVLIDKLMQQYKNSSEKLFFVNVSKRQMDILILEEGKLLFQNSFSYETKEDFIYYILFVAEQLGLHTNLFQLLFSGQIDKESEYYKITYTYVRNIDFIKTTANIFNNSTDFSNHANYTLIS